MINYSLILITNYLGSEWSMNNEDYSTLQWYSSTPKPTQEELDALWIPTQDTVAKNNCKTQASKLLYETDWTTIPDVADPAKSNPYLVNVSAFQTYRNTLRQLAVTPVADPVWPTKPTEQWSTTK